MRKIADSVKSKIISMYSNGKLYREIADETGVSMATIGRLCRDAGVDKFHVGGSITKTLPQVNDALPAPTARPEEPMLITGRTLNMHGMNTEFDYVAGTNKDVIEITNEEWALCVPRDKLTAFIAELGYIRNLIGAR